MHASQRFPRSTPELQGMASGAISNFLTAIQQQGIELHSVMVVRHGHVLAEGWWAPYQAGRPHLLFSLSKSFTSTAIGLAIAEGLLSLDDTVLSFFPEEAPAEIPANLATMQIRHLLMMGTGQAKDTMDALKQHPDVSWVKSFLQCPVEYEPGTHFTYNSGATYMLSAILSKVTGASLLEYLEPRLFKPLGILNPTWESCPRGINV
ncbi:MAG: beta-lactamase family protein, partial [Gorillibacterium sp.]|nr:beta-lactamase family protein [Gorillibacterium sp.]